VPQIGNESSPRSFQQLETKTSPTDHKNRTRVGIGLEGATGDEIRSSPLLSPSNWQFLVRRGVNRELEKTG